MNRRSFLATAPALVSVTAPKAKPALVAFADARNLVAFAGARNRRYVPGTLAAILDGRDISGDCYRAEEYSDGTLVAFCYLRDKSGKCFVVEQGKLATCERKGRGRIVFPQC